MDENLNPWEVIFLQFLIKNPTKFVYYKFYSRFLCLTNLSRCQLSTLSQHSQPNPSLAQFPTIFFIRTFFLANLKLKKTNGMLLKTQKRKDSPKIFTYNEETSAEAQRKAKQKKTFLLEVLQRIQKLVKIARKKRDWIDSYIVFVRRWIKLMRVQSKKPPSNNVTSSFFRKKFKVNRCWW